MSERIYEYRCRCGLEWSETSDDKPGPQTCVTCKLIVMWWRSRPVAPFVPPPPVKLTESELAELRGFGSSYRGLRAHRFKAPEADAGVVSGDAHPNAPGAAPEADSVPVARLESDPQGTRRVRLPEPPREEREQLGFGFSEPESEGGMHGGGG